MDRPQDVADLLTGAKDVGSVERWCCGVVHEASSVDL